MACYVVTQALLCAASASCVYVCRACAPFANLPYNIANGYGPLGTRTISMCARHYNNTLAWDAHNLYGLAEGIATANAVAKITKQRPFVLTRCCSFQLCTAPVCVPPACVFACAKCCPNKHERVLGERVAGLHSLALERRSRIGRAIMTRRGGHYAFLWAAC